MEPRVKVWKKKRPIAVTVVAWAIVLLFLIRLYQVFEPLLRLHVLQDGIAAPLLQGLRPTPLGMTLLTSASYLVLSLIGVVVLIGFLSLRRWAWVVLMAWTGASLLIGLIEYIYSRPNYLVMASNAIVALALNQVEVQRIFHIRIETGDSGFGPSA
jgi:hypothetical protein